ncbi:hypothetical protein RIR_jg7214.t1 [Rhizophagus irregularis DAOM 181602=DAOM 197198]|nr:hypothetical protein RIR_jg7214.t1 [Rhizophagus irregularis DAOM 181602=DAOM 197198]
MNYWIIQFQAEWQSFDSKLNVQYEETLELEIYLSTSKEGNSMKQPNLRKMQLYGWLVFFDTTTFNSTRMLNDELGAC